MKTLKEFLESPDEKRGHLLVIRIPPRRRVLVPVLKKFLETRSE